VAHGLPGDRVHVKGNALAPDPGVQTDKGSHGLFVGRLVEEKGITTLLGALRELAGSVALRAIGSGPLDGELSRAAQQIPGLTWLGACPHTEVLREIGRARFVVVPSQWQEPFGRIVVEALARGTPVIAARIGALEELVAHGRTGLHFRARDASDLARTLRWLASRPLEAAEMAKQARREFETHHGADANRERLEAIYRSALQRRHGCAPVHGAPA
jgi:glycosyltransferase involved in cell wall biosynthesis